MIMAKQDQITKRKNVLLTTYLIRTGKTKRTQEINLQTKSFIEEQNRWVKLRVTTRSIRTISKLVY